MGLHSAPLQRIHTQAQQALTVRQGLVNDVVHRIEIDASAIQALGLESLVKKRAHTLDHFCAGFEAEVVDRRCGFFITGHGEPPVSAPGPSGVVHGSSRPGESV